LIRNLRNNDLEAILIFFDISLAADDDTALARGISFKNILAIINDTASRKIRAFDELHQIFDARLRIFYQVIDGGCQLAQVMRRYISSHTDSDPHRAIQEQIRQLGRQNARLFVAAVIVRDEIDGILIDIQKHLFGNSGKFSLGITHRRRAIAVHRAEVALAAH